MPDDVGRGQPVPLPLHVLLRGIMIVCRKAFFGCLVLGVLTTGCASEKPLSVQLELPSGFENGTSGGESAWPGQDWYRGFSSDELTTFVERARQNNWDLAGAAARIAQAASAFRGGDSKRARCS